VETTKNAVILPIDNGIGVIIPASAFSSDAERYALLVGIDETHAGHAARDGAGRFDHGPPSAIARVSFLSLRI
jgi:hypothetical protein